MEDKKLSVNLSLDKKRAIIIAKRFVQLSVLILVITTLVLGIMIMVNKLKAEETLYSGDEYKIVFLDNNLFYFCQLSDFNSEYIECRNPYYLVRKKETAADGTNEDKIYVRTPAEEEVYQPEGSIFLAKKNIVYIANVGSESSVIEYINSVK